VSPSLHICVHLRNSCLSGMHLHQLLLYPLLHVSNFRFHGVLLLLLLLLLLMFLLSGAAFAIGVWGDWLPTSGTTSKKRRLR